MIHRTCMCVLGIVVLIPSLVIFLFGWHEDIHESFQLCNVVVVQIITDKLAVVMLVGRVLGVKD